MLVSEWAGMQIDNFPQPFYDSIPDVCCHCGFPMEMRETLTGLHCSNPRCTSKIVQRLSAIVTQLGVKNFGEARITSFVTESGIDNPMFIFAYDPDEDGALAENISLELSEKIHEQFNKKRSMTLSEYVRLSNLPFVQTSAKTLFGEFDDIEEAYEMIESEGVEYIQSALGIGKEGVSLRAINIYDSLMTFKQDLFEAVDCVDIIPVNTEEAINITAVVSDEVGGGYGTKASYYALCNAIAPNIHVEFLGAVTKKIDYLIWAGADGSPARYTNKVKKVQTWNTEYAESVKDCKPKGKMIPILTGGQFEELLRKMANGEVDE